MKQFAVTHGSDPKPWFVMLTNDRQWEIRITNSAGTVRKVGQLLAERGIPVNEFNVTHGGKSQIDFHDDAPLPKEVWMEIIALDFPA